MKTKTLKYCLLGLGISCLPLHSEAALPVVGKFTVDVVRGVMVQFISDTLRDVSNQYLIGQPNDEKKQIAELQAKMFELQQALAKLKETSPDVVWMRESLGKLQTSYAQAQDRTSVVEKELVLLRQIHLDKPLNAAHNTLDFFGGDISLGVTQLVAEYREDVLNKP